MLLGLTGGIATGKSTLTRLLASAHPFTVFDADACVHQLLRTDREVIARIQQEFSLPRTSESLPLDRADLRRLIFSSASARQRLEAIIHPVVRQCWMATRAECLNLGRDFLADIPLLLETGAAPEFDRLLVVAAAPCTQRRRLAAKGLEPAMVEAMLASQWPLGQKIPTADHVIWNDGSLAGLGRQASLLLEHLFFPAA